MRDPLLPSSRRDLLIEITERRLQLKNRSIRDDEVAVDDVLPCLHRTSHTKAHGIIEMRQTTLKNRKPTAALLIAIPIFAALPTIAGPRQAASPPTLTKLVLPYTVMTPLPDGRIMGIFTSGPDVFGRYSSDGGRSWTPL